MMAEGYIKHARYEPLKPKKPKKPKNMILGRRRRKKKEIADDIGSMKGVSR